MLKYSDFIKVKSLNEGIEREFIIIGLKVLNKIVPVFDFYTLNGIILLLQNIGTSILLSGAAFYLAGFLAIVVSYIKKFTNKVKVFINKLFKRIDAIEEIDYEEYKDIFVKIVSDKKFMNLVETLGKLDKYDEKIFDKLSENLNKILSSTEKEKLKELVKKTFKK